MLPSFGLKAYIVWSYVYLLHNDSQCLRVPQQDVKKNSSLPEIRSEPLYWSMVI